ncbi:uncharacterized protein [Clytia hemisphaerica]|uniref:uncharacterized protein n=1 Tax=Clytia hemisphaerica TaxID=252671 RepID=UPI0034D6C434
MELKYRLVIETVEGESRVWSNMDGEDTLIVDTWRKAREQSAAVPSQISTTKETQITTVKTNHTTIRPKKKNRQASFKLLPDDPSSKMSQVKNLPGKQPKATEKKAAGQVSRCEICKIVYGSKKDDAFQKEHSINAEYMGCGDCEYWVHVICAGYNVNSQKDIDENRIQVPQTYHQERENVT